MSIELVGKGLNLIGALAPRVADGINYALFRNLKPKAQVADREREVHEQAETGWLDVSGRRIATYQWGDRSGRPVLLVHGWQSRASRFAAFIPPLLEHGFTPVGFDAPANGDSEGRTTTIMEYEAAIHQISREYGPFEGILAHSFGALATFHSLRTSADEPRIVTISGVSNFAHLYEAFSDRLGLNRRGREGLRTKIETRLFSGIPNPWSHFDATRDVHEIPGTVLAIHAADDRVIPVAHAQRISAAFADRGELHITTGLGHHRILSDPAIVGRTVQFLDRRQPILLSTSRNDTRAPRANV